MHDLTLTLDEKVPVQPDRLWVNDVKAIFLKHNLDPTALGPEGRSALFEFFRRSLGYSDFEYWTCTSELFKDDEETYRDVMDLIEDHYPLKFCLPSDKRCMVIPCSFEFAETLRNILGCVGPAMAFNIYGLAVGETSVPMLVTFKCSGFVAEELGSSGVVEYFFPTVVIDPSE